MRGSDLRVAEEFLERFTSRGRCPADELLGLLARDPGAALRWAPEPRPLRTIARGRARAARTVRTGGRT